MTALLFSTSPPAKLNLFLEVLGRRDDGYHELDTVMVAVDWCDELELQPVPEPGIRLHVQWLPDRQSIADRLEVDVEDELLAVPTDDRNLVYRGLQRINGATGYAGGWEARLGKRIPSGAGMGGASSDAAAALRLAAAALRHMCFEGANRLTTGRIRELAAEIGSDVPFFLGDEEVEGSHCIARAFGRGEKLEFFRIPSAPRFVVLFPGVSISTPQVYGLVVPSVRPRSGGKLIDAILSGASHIDSSFLYNALQAPACGLSPRISGAIQWLRQQEFDACQMTGSGSACFAVVPPRGGSVEALARGRASTAAERPQGGGLIEWVTSCPPASEIRIAQSHRG